MSLFQKFIRYMNAAADLVEMLEADLKKGSNMSSETIVQLSRFRQEADNLQDMIEYLHEKDSKLN